MGEKQNQPFQLSFNPSLRVDFQGSRVTSDSGLLLVRELDEHLGLSSLIAEHLTGDRRKNIQLPLPDLLRQSIYSRLAGYEDGMGVKSASCLKSKKRFRVKGIISKINISCAFVLIASSLFFAQQPASTLTKAPQDPPAQPQSPQPTTPQEKPAEQPGTATPPEKSAAAESAKLPGIPKDPKGYAWNMLKTAAEGDKTATRSNGIRVLGLIPKNARARQMAEKALKDEKPEVRSAAATALGDMQARSSIPKLKDALADDEPAVVLSAAHALDLMHDDSAFEVYYEVLTGQRKTSKGLIASQIAVLKDPKKMALLGFEEGIGFVPFAGMGWEAYRRLTKTDPSPVRAAAAKVLAKDPNPDSGKAIGDAASDDKNWLVRSAALEALAKRGDPSLLQPAELAMSDDKEAVKFTAAATVLHLLDVQAAPKAGKKRK